jgi:hypothetical protein
MASKRALRRHRRSERGAAVFVVVMVITLLTAIGVFALRSASLVDQATGYDRQMAQTLALTEYAGRSVSAELGNGAARNYLDKVANGKDDCFVNKNLDPNALDPSITAPLPCYKLFMSEIDQRVGANFSGAKVLVDQSATAAGSLGPQLDTTGILTPQEGVFVVEMSDPAESVPTAGSALGGNNPANTFRDVQLTLTAFGQVRPLDSGAGNPWCASGSRSTAASVSSLRAHVTLRNVPR